MFESTQEKLTGVFSLGLAFVIMQNRNALGIVYLCLGVLVFSLQDAIIKFISLIMITTLILLITYERFVRYTLIGTMLNGPRSKQNDQTQATPASEMQS